MPSSEINVSYAGLTACPVEIAHIHQITQQFSWLSRKEMTATLCEHLGFSRGSDCFNFDQEVQHPCFSWHRKIHLAFDGMASENLTG